MKRLTVIAEVIEPGQCRYFRKGQRFPLGGFTPAGLCASAYAVLARDAETMRYGGTLPWARQGKVLTRCPDPQGALWQLQVEGETATADAERNGAMTASKASEPGGFQLYPCRGLQGGCPFALVRDPALTHEIDAAVRASAWWQGAMPTALRRHVLPRDAGMSTGRKSGPPYHARLRVALAACPNACTMPQIRDIGIIATLTPQAIGPQCNGCGACEQVCREEAIRVRAGRAELHPETCVGCGQCLDHCPSRAIEAGPVKLRVLVGGRMGRHARWAEELGAVDPASAGGVVRAFLDFVAREMPSAGHLAEAVQRIGLERLRREVFSLAQAPAAAGIPSDEQGGPISSGSELSCQSLRGWCWEETGTPGWSVMGGIAKASGLDDGPTPRETAIVKGPALGDVTRPISF